MSIVGKTTYRLADEAEKNVKARLISYGEVEETFKQVLAELSVRPLDEERVIETGGYLVFLLGLCISQMNAHNSPSYPEKSNHLAILEKASTAITYKTNTCTVEEITDQVNLAYRAFGVQ